MTSEEIMDLLVAKFKNHSWIKNFKLSLKNMPDKEWLVSIFSILDPDNPAFKKEKTGIKVKVPEEIKQQ